MCGIAGSLGLGERVPAALRAQLHRGPDHLGMVRGGWGAMGAVRLRINGDARSDMPLRSRSGRTLVAVNGEVFNHRELFAEVDGGSDLTGLPDRLEAEGPRALERLRGPFALCSWDRAEGTLLLARDEVGVRPLYVARSRGGVLAASEIAALDAAGLCSERDEESWDHLLAFQFWPPGRTPWRGVRSVRPGSWERYRWRGAQLLRETGRFTCAAGVATLEEALTRAGADQARRASRAALTLSGGLDSSAVLALLDAAGTPPDLAAVGWFPEAPATLDERPHARVVAAGHGVPLIEVPITARAWWESVPPLIETLGGPLAGPGGPSQRVVARALAEHGVRIVYSGQGGDELFGGYERHRLLQLRDLGLPLTPAAGYEPLAARVAAESPGGVLFRGAALLPHLEPERARAIAEVARAAPDSGPDLAERTLDFEWERLLPGLLTVEDATVAAFGMEGRVPLLDPAVVRATRGIPLAEKSPPADPRRLFRDVLGARLHDAARRRRDKMGFPLPLAAWFEGPLRPLRYEHPGLALLEDLGFSPSLRRDLERGRLGARTTSFVLAVAETLHQRRQRRGRRRVAIPDREGVAGAAVAAEPAAMGEAWAGEGGP